MIVEQAVDNSNNLRPASEVMRLERLGAFRLTSLSFLRIMIRKVMKEAWKIESVTFDLDAEGHGEATYLITTPEGIFTFIVFSMEISEEDRSDRVISEKWDVTFALCEGDISNEKINRLRHELPKQEFGRGDSEDLVWSRANKSGRMFNYVIESLVNEQQPDPEVLNNVGYLFRTTAVYGNGKFGIAPYENIKEKHSFSGAYQAQMFAVYMLRHFSFEHVEHIAHQKNLNAPKLLPEVKRYVGTGNATGLGMVPFLISHPKLLHQWIFIRETALGRVKRMIPTTQECKRFIESLTRVRLYFQQSPVPNVEAFTFTHPEQLATECERVKAWVYEYGEKGSILGEKGDYPWETILAKAKELLSVEAQEMLHTLLLELYAHHVSDLENYTNCDEKYELVPSMSILQLRKTVEEQYSWAFQYDFSNPREKHYFWYRSIEKEEPRIGVRGEDPGEDRALPLNIAEQIQQLNDALQNRPHDETVGEFLLDRPHFRGIVKRVQSLIGYEYGEIQCNLLSEELLPIYLLRCKLSFFGAERFDPKSNRWVRITLFQGAPLVEDIGAEGFDDTWVFPLLPKVEEDK